MLKALPRIDPIEAIVLDILPVITHYLDHMKTYQLTLSGYDGSTDATDHLIKWVNASSLAAVEVYAAQQGWSVQSIETPWGDNALTVEDGVDAILD